MTARLSLVLAILIVACRSPAAPPAAPRPLTNDRGLTLQRLVGHWQWTLESDDAGVHRIERETWELARDPSAPAGVVRAIGAYDRDVEFRSTDGVPFACDEQPVYHQRARFHVRADITGAGVTITETDYQPEPSPCDHGFRKLGSYRASVGGDRITLAWPGGDQTLRRAPDRLPDDPPFAGLAPRWDGAWTWAAHTMDDAGNRRDEQEDWQLTVGDDGVASATYVRTVTTTSIDGRPLACAGTHRWSYVDRYVLDGHRDGDLLTLTEVAFQPGAHPCLATTPDRSLDSLTAQIDGAFLELEWRGKRRQILHRPE
jgi:hypothetical protein